MPCEVTLQQWVVTQWAMKGSGPSMSKHNENSTNVCRNILLWINKKSCRVLVVEDSPLNSAKEHSQNDLHNFIVVAFFFVLLCVFFFVLFART